jgi:hypothetical protein
MALAPQGDGGSGGSYLDALFTSTTEMSGVASPDGSANGYVDIEGPLASTTPEPSTLVLLGAASLSFAGYSWRRRRNAA